ncbi:hypothetical protein C8J56DRAFT_965613, partial [Mycena floridula]
PRALPFTTRRKTMMLRWMGRLVLVGSVLSSRSKLRLIPGCTNDIRCSLERSTWEPKLSCISLNSRDDIGYVKGHRRVNTLSLYDGRIAVGGIQGTIALLEASQ